MYVVLECHKATAAAVQIPRVARARQSQFNTALNAWAGGGQAADNKVVSQTLNKRRALADRPDRTGSLSCQESKELNLQ